MNVRVRPFLICALVAAFVALAAQSPRAADRNFGWKVRGKTGTVYLVGSMHLLTADAYPLNPALTGAFDASDLLVEELDLGEMLAPDSQMRMLNRGLMPRGQTLDQVISPETFAAVVQKLNDLGLPVEPMKQFKPWLLALTLQALEWQKAGFDTDLGLDKHFYDLAVAQKMPVRGLETVDFQLSRFDEMTPPLQDRLLAETMKELDTTNTSFREIATAWKAGDVATIEKLTLADLKSEPEMYTRLLLERNRAWLPQIEALFARPRPSFIVVGAAHLVGPDGLIKMLQSKGYIVEQL